MTLGIFALDMNIYNHINNHKEQIFKTIGKTSKLLFTCRKSVYKEAVELGLFVRKNVIDLQSKDNQLQLPILASPAVMQYGELWLSSPILVHQLLSYKFQTEPFSMLL
jgi:hypothetical protein